MEINEGDTYYGKNFSGLYFDSYSLVLAAGEIGKLRPESVLPFTLCRSAILSAAISLNRIICINRYMRCVIFFCHERKDLMNSHY